MLPWKAYGPVLRRPILYLLFTAQLAAGLCEASRPFQPSPCQHPVAASKVRCSFEVKHKRCKSP